MKLVIAFSAAVLLFVSCDSSDPKPVSDSYLPLEEGNYWQFKSTTGANKGIVQTRTVKGVKTIDGKEYFVIQTDYDDPIRSGPPRDTAYYRVDANGYVFVYNPHLKFEENRYRLLSDDGEKWKTDYYDGNEVDYTLSVSELIIGNRTLTDCKNYYMDVEQWIDEEYLYSLAKGVGFVKESSVAWGGGLYVVKARIGGRIYRFE